MRDPSAVSKGEVLMCKAKATFQCMNNRTSATHLQTEDALAIPHHCCSQTRCAATLSYQRTRTNQKYRRPKVNIVWCASELNRGGPKQEPSQKANSKNSTGERQCFVGVEASTSRLSHLLTVHVARQLMLYLRCTRISGRALPRTSALGSSRQRGLPTEGHLCRCNKPHDDPHRRSPDNVLTQQQTHTAAATACSATATAAGIT